MVLYSFYHSLHKLKALKKCMLWFSDSWYHSCHQERPSIHTQSCMHCIRAASSTGFSLAKKEVATKASNRNIPQLHWQAYGQLCTHVLRTAAAHTTQECDHIQLQRVLGFTEWICVCFDQKVAHMLKGSYVWSRAASSQSFAHDNVMYKCLKDVCTPGI